MSTGRSADPMLLPAPVDPLEVERGSARVLRRMFGRNTVTRVGRYVVLERVGVGATATVYRAYDPALEREVALKILCLSDAAGEWVLREGQSLAQLSHPNVVQIYDVGLHERQAYLAMQFVRGTSLASLFEREPPWREVVRLFIGAGRGLEAAHRQGLVHRDFKPANVLVGRDGEARIADFGLARAPATSPSLGSQVSPTQSEHVRTGTAPGTPLYMAPEQHKGGQIGPHSDQFSFCVALFEGVYGCRPFVEADPAQLVAAKASGTLVVPANRGVPRRLRRAIVRGLRPCPRSRWPSMGALVRELESLSRVRGRRLAIAAGVAVAAMAMASVVAVPPDCPPATRIEQSWNRTRADEVAAAFAASNPTTGAEVAGHFSASLDDYAARWTQQWQQSCEATHVRAEQSEGRHRQRLECLTEAADDVGTLVGTVLRADIEGPRQWASALAWLPALDRCERPEDHGTLRAPPPHARTAVHELMGELREAEAVVASGGHLLVRASVLAFSERAEAIGYAPLQGRANLLRSRVLLAAAELEEAYARANDAFFVAASHDDREAAFDSAVQASVVARKMARFDASLAWARHARVLLGSPAPPSTALARVLDTSAWTRFLSGDVATAHDEQRRALAMFEETAGPDHPATHAAAVHLSMVQAELGRTREAVATAAETVAAVQRARGKRAVGLTHAYAALGTALAHGGDHEQSIEAHERALSIRRLYYAADHPSFVAPLQNIGAAHAELGRLDEAASMFAAAVDVATAAYGPQHPHADTPRLNLARARLRLGHRSDALATLREARAALEARADKRSRRQLTVALTLEAKATLMRPSDPAKALAAAELALDAGRALEDPRSARAIADARFVKARALRELGADPAEVLTVARAAKAQLEAVGANTHVEQVQRFIDAPPAARDPRNR